MMGGRYMSRNVAVTMKRVNVVRIFARRSWFVAVRAFVEFHRRMPTFGVRMR